MNYLPNMTYDIQTLISEAIGLLKSLIAIPSLSRDEEKAAKFAAELYRDAGYGNRT